ncbi:MAG TPA: hypothetical protein VFK48_18960 [Usitatibacter sp.]|nr:hypothetical protein [Usitatibacter sp.]
MEMPPQVRRAVILLWIALVAAIGSMVFAFDVAAFADPEMASFVWPFLIGTVILNAALIHYISRRRNWARVVLLVLTIAGIAVMVWPFDDVALTWDSLVSDVAFTALDVIALYWLFTGPGAVWFARRNAGAF